MIIIKDLAVAQELSHEKRAAVRGGLLIRKAGADSMEYLSFDFSQALVSAAVGDLLGAVGL